METVARAEEAELMTEVVEKLMCVPVVQMEGRLLKFKMVKIERKLDTMKRKLEYDYKHLFYMATNTGTYW